MGSSCRPPVNHQMISSPVFGPVYAACVSVGIAICVVCVDLYAIPIAIGEDAIGVPALTLAGGANEFIQRDAMPSSNPVSELLLPPLDLGDARFNAGRTNPLTGDARFDRAALARGASPVQPEAHDGDQLLKELSRSFSASYSEPDNNRVARADRARRDPGSDLALGTTGFVYATENIVKEAITGAIEVGLFEVTQQDLSELGAMLGNLRQSLGLSGSEVAESMRLVGESKDGFPDGQQRDALDHTPAGTSQLSQSRESTSRVTKIGDFIRSILAEPITIITMVGLILMAAVIGSKDAKGIRPKHRTSKSRRTHRRSSRRTRR